MIVETSLQAIGTCPARQSVRISVAPNQRIIARIARKRLLVATAADQAVIVIAAKQILPNAVPATATRDQCIGISIARKRLVIIVESGLQTVTADAAVKGLTSRYGYSRLRPHQRIGASIARKRLVRIAYCQAIITITAGDALMPTKRVIAGIARGIQKMTS